MRGNHRPGGNHSAAFHHRAIQYRRMHPNEAAILQRTGMQHHLMPNGDAGTDDCRPGFPRHMHHRIILDVRARADADMVYVAAHDATEPDAGMIADFDIADNHRPRRDEGGGGDFWGFAFVWKNLRHLKETPPPGSALHLPGSRT